MRIGARARPGTRVGAILALDARAMHHAVRTLALLAALVLALAADPARALSISGIVVAPAGANTADVLVDNGAPRNEVASSVGLVGSAPGPVADVSGASVSFGTRYAWLVAADREAGGGTTSVDATASYTITFTVDNPLGLLYRIDVDTSRFGTLAIVDDGSGGASLTLGAVTGLLDGVSDAALGLGAQTFAATGSQAVSQTGATSSLVESATSRTYTLAFSWTATATSERDEAALLLGLAGALSSTSADDYAGDPSGDGHFVNVGVTILPVPEPFTLTLVGGGLAGLALAGRRRHALPRA